jgi:hypothetical protein
MLSFKNSSDTHEQVPTDSQQGPAVNANPGAQKKVTSERRREANRRNASHSTGPRNTERTRYNATRHGLLSKGLTQWDNTEEYEETVRQLTSRYLPSNPFHEFLIQRVALEMIRTRRIGRMEAENITLLSSQHAPSSDSDQCTPMIDPTVMQEYAGPLLDRLQRYDSANINRLLRCWRELERIPRDEPNR